MPSDDTNADVTALTVQLLSAYLANNSIASEDLAGLIRTTRAALIEDASPPAPEEAETYTPAVSVRKSLSSPDHILSLIDGKPYKTLKRHLSTHGLTPESYRERYNLPAGYPMVAPTFAARRREIAEQIGLGNKRKSPQASSPAVSDAAMITSDEQNARAPKTVSSASKPSRAKAKSRDASVESGGAATTKRGSNKPGAVDASADAIQAASTPKQSAQGRRGKLGLFGAKDPADKASGLTTQAPVADDATQPKKAAKAKRMARAPKSSGNQTKN